MNGSPDVRNAQLFLDEGMIEQTVRLQRIIHQPHKYHGNPVYTVGAAWGWRNCGWTGSARSERAAFRGRSSPSRSSGRVGSSSSTPRASAEAARVLCGRKRSPRA